MSNQWKIDLYKITEIFCAITSLKWLSDHKRSLACDFSLVWNFWLCSRQYFRLLSCSRIILLDLINLLCLIWDSDSFRLIQTHSDSFSLIEPHWDSWRRIRRILRKRALLARIGLMMRLMMRMMKSHFLKRCSLSERLKKGTIWILKCNFFFAKSTYFFSDPFEASMTYCK